LGGGGGGQRHVGLIYFCLYYSWLNYHHFRSPEH
jgi:phosphatidylserine decarboxylase